MALTRKFLSAMGIEDEKIDEIIKAHRDTVDVLKDERDKYKDEAEKLPGVQKDLEEAAKKVAEFEGAGWEAKYNDVKKEYDGYRASVDAEKSKAKKSEVYKGLLREVGISEKWIDPVLRVANLDSLEIGEDGKPKDSDKIKGDIAKEWADLIPVGGKEGAKTTTPPEGGDGGHGLSRAAQVAARHYEAMYGKKAEETK